MEEYVGSPVVFWGILGLISGVAVAGGVLNDNDWFRVRWHVWDRSEHIWAVVGSLLICFGTCFVVFGCGESRPEPADPVHVEVDRPESDFEPTMAVYAYLAVERAAVAECEAARVPFEEGRVIRAAARQEMQLLRDEFVAYVEFGQGGSYCGPVCEAMQKFLFEGDGAEILSSCEE